MAADGETMQAAVYGEYGDSSVLEVKAVPKPGAPGAGEVTIAVRTAGVNPVDWKIRKGYLSKMIGQTFPTIPGWDVAGDVVAVGEGVSELAVGDAVFSYNRPVFEDGEKIGANGDAAEFVNVPAARVAKKPASVDYNTAGAVPLAGLTAWQGLFDKAGVKEGTTVLVLNASGGVGSFAVQFAKARGATVIGTCSAKNVEYVKGLGADAVVDYTAGGVAEAALAAAGAGGIDVLYDAVGGEDNVAAGLAALKEGGFAVSIAFGGIGDAAKAAGKTGEFLFVSPNAGQLGEIAALIDAGTVKVGALATLPLADIAKAHDNSEAHRTVGKVVLTIGA